MGERIVEEYKREVIDVLDRFDAARNRGMANLESVLREQVATLEAKLQRWRDSCDECQQACENCKDRAIKRVRDLAAERDQLLALTETWAEHPEGYDGPCLCQECKSCN